MPEDVAKLSNGNLKAFLRPMFGSAVAKGLVTEQQLERTLAKICSKGRRNKIMREELEKALSTRTGGFIVNPVRTTERPTEPSTSGVGDKPPA